MTEAPGGKIDPVTLNQWRCENGHKVYPALLPDGTASPDGSKWCVGAVEIDLKPPGHCVDTLSGECGEGLFDVARMTGLPWPKTIMMVKEIMTAALAVERPTTTSVAKLNGHGGMVTASTPARPNGHDASSQYDASTLIDREVGSQPKHVAIAPMWPAAPGPNDGPDENRPFHGGTQKRSNAAEPEIIPPARTIDQILEEARTLTRDSSPATIARLNGVLQHIAEARLDPASTDMVLSEIKRHTDIGIGSLRGTLKTVQQQVRCTLKPVATSEVAMLCRRYVYVKAVGAFWDRLTRTILGIDAVRHGHWPEMPLNDYGDPADPYDVMLKGTFGRTVDRVDKITFLPGSSEIVEEDGAKCLNVWTVPDITPQPGDVSPFLNHIEYILDGDSAAACYLLDWLAHLVQKPWIKIKSAILIIGGQGIGKSLIAEMFATIIGRRNTTAIQESDLRSQFNEWIDGKQLVIVHELMTLDRQETMNRLKSYVTETMVRINRKNVNTYDYPNRTNFLMFSNHRDAAKIEEGDRRYFIWISQAKKRDNAYYTEFWQWFEDGGAEALLYFLATRDITAFNPNAAPPATASKDEVIELSRGAIDAYLKEAFEARQAPFQHDLIVVNDVLDFLRETKRMTISHTVLSKFLRSVDAVPFGQKRLTPGEGSRRLSFWALRDTERYAKVPDGQFGQLYRDQVAAPLSPADKDAIFQRIGVV